MEKIRIGNDIRVRSTLSELGSWDSASIKQLRAYFIRVEDEQYDQNHTSKYPQFYTPTQYSINACGCYQYNMYPCNMYYNDPHWFPGYNGFGVCSTPFEHCSNEFQAPVKVLPETNRFEAYFPADCQKYLGEYKLVFVVCLYESGWGLNNVRTFTIDKGSVFVLSDKSGTQSSVDIDLDTDTRYKLSISGDNVDNSKTTLPSSVSLGEAIRGRIYVKEGYIITNCVAIKGGQAIDYDFVLNNEFVDFESDPVDGDITFVVQSKYVGTCIVILTGEHVDKAKSTIPQYVPKGCDLIGTVKLDSGYKVSNAILLVDGVVQQYPFVLNNNYVDIDIKTVKNNAITIKIEADAIIT